jgi:bifunctional non-homologous end joining protein LigD
MSALYDRPVNVIDAIAAAERWRPQRYGDLRAQDIENPLIEPQWSGVRVLALVDEGQSVLRDEAGDPVTDGAEAARAIVAAVRSPTLIIDGYLTNQVSGDDQIIVGIDEVEVPTAQQTMAQLFLGRRRNRRTELAKAAEEEQAIHKLSTALPISFVAVDLLWLDDTALLEVPLLERKRLLESVVVEAESVRIGAYVRPPIGPWIGSWRASGFTRIVYKGSNSRYLPGERNQDWASVAIPRE